MAKESLQEQILRASKEIAVKFIEVGRLSPTNFGEAFKTIYDAIESTIKGDADGRLPNDDTKTT